VRFKTRLDSLVRTLPFVIAALGSALLVLQWSWGRMLWLDEEMIAINFRDRSFWGLTGALSLAQAAPYGWLVLERTMLLLFGDGERSLRTIPVLFGIATLASAVWVGRRWMTPAGAIALVFLCAMGQWVAFHALELKHYSADVCFGLLLPALAVFALEDETARAPINRKRIVGWWIVAAAAQWFSNGALFVAPACAVMLLVAGWRRLGWRGVFEVGLPGAVWLVSFAANYRITLAPALASDFLRGYWSSAFPPPGSGPVQTVRWLWEQLGPVAVKPGGSGFGVVFWIVSAAGFIAAVRCSKPLRFVYLSIPIWAFVFAALRVVPMSERLGLWFVPALYVGVALAAQATATLVSRAATARKPLGLAAGLAAAALLVAMAVDVYQRGTIYMTLTSPTANHELDDRAAVRWLLRERRPGDVWMASYLTLPAIWWYAGNDASSPAVEASFDYNPANCGPNDLAAWVKSAHPTRALVYLGFGHDTPPPFADLLVQRLTAIASVTAYRPVKWGHVLIVDFQSPSIGTVTLGALSRQQPDRRPETLGCIAITPARRW
jgi:hypothetical protein